MNFPEGSTQPGVPTEKDAVRIFNEVTDKHAASTQRFSTGLAHYVYDIKTINGEEMVVRLTKPELVDFFKGAKFWYELLKPKGIPLPTLIYSSTDLTKHEFPVMVMERLPGKDLDAVYTVLSEDQKRNLARRIVSIQNKVHELPQAQGFGYAKSYDSDQTLFKTWADFLESQLDDSKKKITEAGIFDPQVVEKVQQTIREHSAYFSSIKPTAFLDDTTTKNVIMDKGELTGIVDVDFVCFGDPLRTPALTNMALLSRGWSTDYIDYWLHELNLSDDQRKAFKIYTAMYCVGFMSEKGQKYNKEIAEPVEEQTIQRFKSILDGLLEAPTL